MCGTYLDLFITWLPSYINILIYNRLTFKYNIVYITYNFVYIKIYSVINDIYNTWTVLFNNQYVQGGISGGILEE